MNKMPRAKRPLADGAGNPQSTALGGDYSTLHNAAANTQKIGISQYDHNRMNAPDRYAMNPRSFSIIF